MHANSFCWSDQSSQYSTSTVPGAYDSQLLTVQLSSTPTSESYSSTTGPQIMASNQSYDLNNIITPLFINLYT